MLIPRVIIRISPGDTIPRDCTIVSAFSQSEVRDVHQLVIEAEWLPSHGHDGSGFWYPHMTLAECHALWVKPAC